VGRLRSITHISMSTLAPAGNALLGMPQSGEARGASKGEVQIFGGFGGEGPE
jgi:hypothetical protein